MSTMSTNSDKIKQYLKDLTVPLGEMIDSCDKIIGNIASTGIDEFNQIGDTIQKKTNENETYKDNEKSNTGKLINALYQAPKQSVKGLYNLGKGLFGTVGLVAGATTAGAAGITAGALGGVAGAAMGAVGYNNSGMFKGAKTGASSVLPRSYFTRFKTKPAATVGGGKKTKKHNKHKKTEKRQKRQKRHKKQKTYKN
jgi:hypothetical protein